jgi:hypothetical protein
MKQKPTVQVGAHVIVELLSAEGQAQRLEFDIVPDQAADFSRGYLSASTPLAKAILNKPAGVTIPYRQADILQVHILSVSPTVPLPVDDLTQQRKQAARKALEQVQRTNAILFASSFSGKWGDYDPDGIDHWDETDQDSQ